MTIARASFCAMDALNESSLGFSDTASILRWLNDDLCEYLREPVSLGLQPFDVFNELFELAEECAEEGWDGENAKPVTKAVFDEGFRFLRSLPLHTVVPSVSAEPDGHIVFEWYRSTSRVLSVSIDSEGFLHYAAIIGSRKAYGTEPFTVGMPEPIIGLIGQVVR
ncbi:MAG: hypothetical protein PHC90_11005 [Syntrophorhabdaceae bacterium]|nr:hypothetical protein [Syntrophorhabdaceae bacterium]